MGAIYTLSDETERRDLIEVSGRAMTEIMRFMDKSTTPGARVNIFVDSEYVGYDTTEFDPVRFEAPRVETDMRTIINALSLLPNEHAFGPFTVAEWTEIFGYVETWAKEHPESVFRSQYYE